MYIQRSVLLLVVLIYLVFLVGMDWFNSTNASWYKPFLMGLTIIALSAWLQRYQEKDDY